MRGFLAVDGDGRTIRGLQFYEHAETPGLGDEIDNPNWLAQFEGRLAFDDDGAVRIAVIKGAAPDDPHAVNSIAGATLTANGVSNMLQYWLGDDVYGPYLAQFRQLCGPPTTFPGNDFVALRRPGLADRPYDDRLDNALRTN